MLAESKHLAGVVIRLLLHARCFAALSMTFFMSYSMQSYLPVACTICGRYLLSASTCELGEIALHRHQHEGVGHVGQAAEGGKLRNSVARAAGGNGVAAAAEASGGKWVVLVALQNAGGFLAQALVRPARGRRW